MSSPLSPSRPRLPYAPSILAVLLTLALLLALMVTPPSPASALAREPAPLSHTTGAGTTPAADSGISLRVAASPAALPPGGTQVTLTYTVTNTTASRAYYRSLTDDRCPSPRHLGGMKTDSVRWYLEPGASATFSCDFFAGITTTARSTATFTTVAASGTWADSTASTSVALTVAQDQCATLWSASQAAGTETGRIGTVATSGTAAITPRWTISALTAGAYDSSTALAVDPRNPAIAYFIPSRVSTYGGLWRLDLETGAATRLAPATNATSATTSVRLAMGQDGTLWSWNTSGVLWSLGAGANAWVEHRIAGASTADGRQSLSAASIRGLSSGDLVVGGGGNLWLLAADSTAGITYLLALSEEQARTTAPRAILVGQMNRPTYGGFYNGLAFGTRGELYASAGSRTATSATNTLYEVDMGTGRATPVSSAPAAANGSIGDLGSCAKPRSRMQVLTRAVTSGPAVMASEEITYRIEVSNLGTLASVGATLQDSIPAHTTYKAGSTTLNGITVPDVAGAMPFSAGQEIHGPGTPRTGQIPGGETAIVTFTVTVNDPVPSSVSRIENSATFVDINNPGGKPSDDPAVPGATDVTTVQIARPAIGVTTTVARGAGKDALTGAASARLDITGSSALTYRYEVVNLGGEPLAGVVLSGAATRGGEPSPHACASPVLQGGDMDRDLVLDPFETWVYTCPDTLAWTPQDSLEGTTVVQAAAVSATGEVTGSSVSAQDSATVTLLPQPATFELSTQPGVAVGPEARTGEIVASSSIVVHNAGQLTGAYAPIPDTPAPPPGMRVLRATWLLADHDGLEQSWDGSGPFEIGASLTAAQRTLAPGETHRYRVRVVLAWNDANVPELLCENGGGIRNTAAFTSGTDATGAGDNTACVDAPHPPRPGITLTTTGTAPDSDTATGSPVSYTYTVTNTSALVFLEEVTVTDPRAADLSCPAGPLAPGEAVTCTGTAAVTTPDLEAGTITTTATASATPAGFRTPITSEPSTVRLPLNTTAQVSLQKDVLGGANIARHAGEQITFRFTVTNSGNKLLARPTITDQSLGVTDLACGPSSLPIGYSTSCEASYTLTAKDIDRGRLLNVATVATTGVSGGVEDTAAVTAVATATVTGLGGRSGLWLEKRQVGSIVDADGSGDHSLGDTLWYNFEVRNLSDAGVTDIVVTDTKAGAGVVCDRTELGPWESTACRLMQPYRLTEADIVAGTVVNTATATGGASGTNLTSNEASATTPVSYEPHLAVTMAAGALTEGALTEDTPAGPSKGDTIDYTFTVTNPTALPVTDVVLTAEKLAGIDLTCEATTIPARGTVACWAQTPYLLTRADVDARSVDNVVTATATGARGGVVSARATSSTPVVPLPRLRLSTTHTGPTDGTSGVGDTLTFQFTLSNDGAGTLRDLRVAYPMLGLDEWCTDAGATLEPGQSVLCTPRTYTVTQHDVDHLGATTVATASAVAGPADAPSTIGARATDTFRTITPMGSLEIDKYFDQLDDVDASGGPSAGDLLRYRFEVVNTGTATLRFLAVDDERIGLIDHSCGNRDIAPGGTLRCTAPAYRLTAADLREGTVIVNDARAEAVTYQGEVVTGISEPVSTDVAIVPRGALTITKSGDLTLDANGDGAAQEGDEVTYSFVVRNAGTVPVAQLEVVDPLLAIAGATLTCAATALEQGESTTCASTPMRVRGDEVGQFITDGKIVNVATALAEVPSSRVEEGASPLRVFSPSSVAAVPIEVAVEAPPVEAPPVEEPPVDVEDNPGEPGDPGDPFDPGNSVGPDTPGVPGTPGDPGDGTIGPWLPGGPALPSSPGVPGLPVTPGSPGTPGNPVGHPGSAGLAPRMDARHLHSTTPRSSLATTGVPVGAALTAAVVLTLAGAVALRMRRRLT